MEEGYDSYPQGGMDDYGGGGGHDNGGPPMDDGPRSGGRGRGRGRGRGGGEPVFSDAFMGNLGGMGPPPEVQGGQFDDVGSAFPMGDMGGGRGRGRGRGEGGRGRGEGGRGRGRGDGGRGRGRGGDGDGRGPPGLFKTTDWTCPMCGNVNWERRSTCNMCQTSKPNIAGVGENRDGIGGGFNERQERGAATLGVEISEDGYDDFGRIIKKQPADRKAKEAAALARLKQTFGTSSLSIVTDAQLPVSNPVTAIPSTTTDVDRRDDRDDQDRDRERGRNGGRENGSSRDARREGERGGERGRDRSRSRERRGGDRDDKYSRRDDDRGRDAGRDRDRRDNDRGRDRRDRSRSRDRRR